MMKSSDMIWRCTNRSCIAKLKTDSAISTIIPSGTGLVEKIQTRLQYNDNSNEIRKRLDYSFGFHFLCPPNVEMWAEIPSDNKRTNNAAVPCPILHRPSNNFRIS